MCTCIPRALSHQNRLIVAGVRRLNRRTTSQRVRSCIQAIFRTTEPTSHRTVLPGPCDVYFNTISFSSWLKDVCFLVSTYGLKRVNEMCSHSTRDLGGGRLRPTDIYPVF